MEACGRVIVAIGSGVSIRPRSSQNQFIIVVATQGVYDCSSSTAGEAMASQWTINVKVITGQVTRIQALNGPVSWQLYCSVSNVQVCGFRGGHTPFTLTSDRE